MKSLLLSLWDEKQNEKEEDDTAIDREKTTDVYNNKHIEAENECVDNLNDDSCENDKKIAELWTEK